MEISGNATTVSGAPADFVRAFSWPNHELAGTAVPDENGDWSITIETTGDYGITYIAADCQPITHGPYFIETGQAALPTEIGEEFGGGYYAGDIQDGDKWYKLIVADVEADVYGLPWGAYGVDWPATSTTDGSGNTETMRGDSRFEAGNHCLNHTGGGHSDWYMPARGELAVLYENLAPDNAGTPTIFRTGQPQAFHGSQYYWCSTQHSSYNAWRRRFSDGNELSNRKHNTSRRVRPVRRLEFTP